MKWKDCVDFIKKKFQNKSTYAGIALIASLFFLGKAAKAQNIASTKLSYFLLALSQNLISEVIVQGKTIVFRPSNGNSYFQTDASMLSKDKIFTLLQEKPEVTFSSVDKNKNAQVANLVVTVISGLLSYIVIQRLISPQKTIKPMDDETRSSVTFKDIYGMDIAKKQLQEIIDYLKNPLKYQAVGARLRKGVMIYGPPGTGKTMLAKATAGESNASFISTTASEFVEMYVGVGAKRVRDLFQTARSLSPCIIFIDEIDGIGSRRKSKEIEQQGGDTERATTLNQLLTEMDGFLSNQNVVVIAATNRLQLIDDALLRSGRFDTKIGVKLPDESERKGIIQVHLRNKKNNISDSQISSIAKKAVDFSGADIENITNESAYCCIHRGDEIIQDEDINTAFQKVYSERLSQYQY